MSELLQRSGPLPSYVPAPERYFAVVLVAFVWSAYLLGNSESPNTKKIAKWLCLTMIAGMLLAGVVFAILDHTR